jgi:hypothetical protein
MTDKHQWDRQILGFLKKTGEQIRGETEKILTEIRDPQNQQRMRASLNEFSSWAKQTAEEATSLMESALKKAEAAISQAAEKVKHSSAAISSPQRAGRRTPSHKGTPKRRAGTTRRPKRSGRT